MPLNPNGCSAISCTAGFTCYPDFDCVPTSTDWHHCARRACGTDADCDCGACVNGACQASIWVCAPSFGNVP